MEYQTTRIKEYPDLLSLLKNIDVRKRKDTLTAGQALADDLATGTFNARCRFIVPASDGNTYFFLDARIYKRTSGGTYSLVYTDLDGGINGACEWGNNVGDIFFILDYCY